jgi:sec-independent protein translocase protein TatB
MFDIGWSELLLVLIVALVVVGPKDLPRLMRTVGRWVGRARSMADQFRSSFDEMARETELDELRQEIQALRTNNPLSRTAREIENSIQAPDTPPDTPNADTSGPEDEPAPDEIHIEPAEETHANHQAPLLPESDAPADEPPRPQSKGQA